MSFFVFLVVPNGCVSVGERRVVLVVAYVCAVAWLFVRLLAEIVGKLVVVLELLVSKLCIHLIYAEQKYVGKCLNTF